MIFALIAALLVAVIAFVWLLDRSDKRSHLEREAVRKEMQLLANRIQAPEVAVAQTLDREPSRERLYVPLDDDAAWHAHQLERVGVE